MKKAIVALTLFAGVLHASAAVLYPSGTPAETRQTIQAAIDAAVPDGMVELGEGTFDIDQQLTVANGVTLKGQGWEKTIIRQATELPDGTASDTTRCVTLDGGARLERVTLTGGHLRTKWASGAGAAVKDGTISWCRIIGNQTGDATYKKVTVNNIFGAGVSFVEGKGQIDHSIIASNAAYMNGGGTSHGGGIGVYKPSGEVLVDTCLLYGNSAPSGDGGAIYAQFDNNHKLLTVRNTTIANNTTSGKGGGVYVSQNVGAPNYDLRLVNSILADNVAGNGDGNLALPTDSRLPIGYAAQSFGNVFANGTAALGEDSKSIEGSGAAWFADAANGNFEITASSLARKAGRTYPEIGVDLADVAFASQPSAGCYEYVGSSFVVEPPTFEPAACVFFPSISVTLSCSTDGATIYYTLDGSEPTEWSAIYEDELVLTATTTVKARAFKDGFEPSGIFAATYRKWDPSAVIFPGATPAETRANIQEALDVAAAEAEPGTVTLGADLFEIDRQLSVANGVTLKGQGWEKTIIRQTGAKQRVATLDGGAKLVGVTVTGGRVSDSWAGTAGVQVNDGTISWCRITENKATGRNSWGGGVALSKGVIDHTIIDHNQGGDYSGGGGISVREPAGETIVDTCLVYGNTAPHGDGGGIYANFGNAHKLLTVRNTTIANNTVDSKGGGVYVAQNPGAPNYDFKLVNSILADNTAGSGDENLALPTNDARLPVGYAAQSFGNVFANGTAALGDGSKSVAGSGETWFTNAADGNFEVTASSPARKAGRTYPEIDVDLADSKFTDPPSAGCYEYAGSSLVVEPPTFEPAACVFFPSISVTLSCATEDATIRYTTDGSDPTEESAIYEKAFVLTATTTIKACAFKDGFVPSGIFAATYRMRDPSAVITPGETPAETRANIQEALDAAAAEAESGTVTLGEGLFEIDGQLTLTGGVTLKGQGWEKTIIRQTIKGLRVATLKDGAKLVGVTVTGGKISDSWTFGAGLSVEGGSVSWCRITGNAGSGHNENGGGIHISGGMIDHCIIDSNQSGGGSGSGGGIAVYEPAGEVVVDTCLIYGNTTPNGDGGGIYANFGNCHKLLTVRNTTIANNTTSGKGGGICVTQNVGAPNYDLKLVNSILADNTAGSGDANLALPADARLPAGYAAQSFGNVFANGTAALGDGSKSVEGSGETWFTNAADGDYRPKSVSPAVGAGMRYEGLDKDLKGIKFSRIPSAGCYELVRGFSIFVL